MDVRKNTICHGAVGFSILAILPNAWIAIFARLMMVLGSGAAGGIWGFLVFLLTTQIKKRFNILKKVGGQDVA